MTAGRPSLVLTAIVVVVMALLGFLSNLATVWMGYGISLIFGSIFPIVVTALFGLWWGLPCALLASSATWVIWSHPYAIVIMTAEVAFLGVMLARGRRNIVLADTLYWLVLGMPLVFLFYYGVMGINGVHTYVIALKQMLNGILDALIASMIVNHLPVRRWLRLGSDRIQVSYSQIIFHATSVMVLLSAFGILLLTSHHQVEQMQRDATSHLREQSGQLGMVLDDWLHVRLRAVEEVADVARHFGVRPSAVLQETLRRTVGLFPDFHNAYVGDSNGRSVAFFPKKNERGESTLGLDFSDRPYFQELSRTLRPVISDVFVGRGGVFVPIFAVAYPVVDGGRIAGFGLAAVDLQRLSGLAAQYAQSDFVVTIVDEHEHVVISTDAQRRPMQALVPRVGASSVAAPDVKLYVPGVSANSSVMETWKGAYYSTRRSLTQSHWTLVVESAVAPLQDKLFLATTFNLELLLGVFLLGLFLSHFLGDVLARTPSAIARVSRAVPEKLRTRSEIEWPHTDIVEMVALIENFKETASELGARMREIEETNEILEQRVRERTEALQSLTDNLERRVEEQIQLRAKDEQMLVQQSKMAAMGEMLGAIAHQWRQPLNTLGLCMQNIEVTWDEGELDDVILHGAVERGMRQIRHMSKTIDDFRSFFTSDRERVVFDVGAATADVLALFSAQLQANRIALEVRCLDHETRGEGIDALSCGHQWMVLGIAGEFEHVVLNLLSNAKDAILERRLAGAESAGRIDFALATAGGQVLLRVTDDGMGITPEIRDRMFEPYFTTKQESKGTGMGLYISRVIIEDHFLGRLSAENVGQGASMVISLPATSRRPAFEEDAREEVGSA